MRSQTAVAAAGRLPWPATPGADEVFWFEYRRVVAHDNTVSFGTHLIDIRANRHRLSYARDRVEVHHHFDGSLLVHVGGRCIARSELCGPTGDVHTGDDSHRASLVTCDLNCTA